MSSDAPQRPLEQMGISPETTLPEGVLTPAKAKSVRFTQTRPGYHYTEVETFVAQVQSSLDVYAKLLHDRDLDVYKLDESIARSQVDLKNKNNQIEVLLAQGDMAQVNVDDSEVALLLETNDKLRQELQSVKDEYSKVKTAFDELNIWASEAEEYISNLKEQDNNVSTPAIAKEPEFEEPAFEQPVEEETYTYEQYVEPEQPHMTGNSYGTYEEEEVEVDTYEPEPEPEPVHRPVEKTSPKVALMPGLRLDDLE